MSESRLGSSKLARVKFHFGSRKNREEIRKNEKSKYHLEKIWEKSDKKSEKSKTWKSEKNLKKGHKSKIRNAIRKWLVSKKI